MPSQRSIPTAHARSPTGATLDNFAAILAAVDAVAQLLKVIQQQEQLFVAQIVEQLLFGQPAISLKMKMGRWRTRKGNTPACWVPVTWSC